MPKHLARTALSRRRFLLAGGALTLSAGGAAFFATTSGGSPTLVNPEPRMTVWKSPSCGCCRGWIDHMETAGFAVDVVETDDLDPLKSARGIPVELHACHTAEIAGYAVEGHVPAAAIAKLLAEKPDLDGIALPGMPAGSPGMGGPAEALEVLGFSGGRTLRPFWTGTV